MAKFCEVCKRSYPDDQERCPRCAGAVEDSGVDLGARQGGESPSSISGVSAVDWAGLVEEPAAPAVGAPAREDSAVDLGQGSPPHTGAHPAPVDSPSDADLRGAEPVAEGKEPAEGGEAAPSRETSPPAPEPKATILASAQAKVTSLAAAQARVTSLAATEPKATALAPGEAKATTLASGQEMVQDLLAGEGPSQAGTEEVPADLQGAGVHLGQPVEEPSASEGAESSGDPDASLPHAVETSGVHLGQSVEEPPGLESEAPVEAGSSGVHLTDVVAEAAESPSDKARVEPVSDSGIELGEEAVVVEDVTGEPLPGGPVAAADSGINLVSGRAEPPETPLPVGPAAAGDSGILVDRDLALEEPVTPRPPEVVSGEAPSGRDLIAEAVESGVDLPGPRVELTESEASEVVSLDAPGGPVVGPSSSSVDLGSSAEVELPPVSEGELPLEEVAASGADAVDLEGLPEPPPTGSGLTGPEVSASSVDLGSHAEVETEKAGLSGLEESVESGIDLGELPESGGVDVGEGSVAVGDEAVEDDEAGELVGAGVGADEEEAETRPLPTRPEAAPRGRKGAWLGGTFLGLLLGAGTLLGLWAFGIEPPSGWRMVGPAPKDNKAAGPIGPAKGPAAAESRADLLRRGEFDRAAQAGGAQAQEDKPEALAERGEARWLSHLTRQRKAKAPVKADDPAVKQAMEDLTRAAAANNANGLFWLGHIQEQTGQVAEAEKTYARGAEQFKGNAVQKGLFEAALNRVQAMGQAAPPAGGVMLPPDWRNDPLALAALVVFALQQPPMEQPADDTEAGVDFWQAVKLARDQKYTEALQAIDKARAVHDQRRFAHLRQAQNLLSDPTEEIFLKSCDELKAYWQMEEKLKKGGYLNLADKKDPVKATDDLVKAAAAGGESGKVLAALADKLTRDKIIDKPEDLDKGVDQLLGDRKEALMKIADQDKKLKASMDKAATLEADLKTSKEEAAGLDKKLKESVEREGKLKTELASEQTIMQGVVDSLKAATFLDAKAGKEDVPAGLKDAIRIARMVDPMGYIRKLEGRVSIQEGQLKERWRPEEMLTFWLPLMEQDRDRKDLAAKALQDVGRVLKDPEATPADRAHAEVIRGLALRNDQKFAAAQEALRKAQEDLKGDRNAWTTQAEGALKEVSDPAGWYASQAEGLHNQGKSSEALELLGRAVEALPGKEQASLLAQRSLIELDVARAAARGPIPRQDPTLAAARKDATEAARAGLAEGFYAAGRVAEEMGQWDAAADNYRKALAAHPAVDAAGSRYRIALARVLVTPRETRPAGAPPAPPPPPPEPKAGGDKVGRLDSLPDAARRAEALRFAALLAVLALQAPDLQPLTPAQEEAEKLADEVLKAPPDKVPFDVRAQALALKGRWTLGLLSYVEGLRPFLPPRYATGLLDLVRNHPRLKRPDTLVVPNPLDAEKHYAAGLNFYFDRDYPSAEKEFAAAVENDSQDARYFYFLGLSRLAQNKREAYEDLDQGAVLEGQNRPPSPVVSVALERIQGPMRRIVNDARTKPR